MGTFNKLKKNRKSSHLDEKIEFLNKELKKTGVVCEAAPANSTAGIYNIIDFTPGLPEIRSDVPDSTGFIAGTSTQDANGGDESDSDTWENGWNNISDMQNSNNLNGETNRNIPFTPDLSGWSPAAQSNRSSQDPIGSGFGGIATWSISSGIGGGKTIGTITAGNTYVGMVVPDNIFSTYNFPRYPRTNRVYAWYSDSEYQAAHNIAVAYEANKTKGSVKRMVWVPYDIATSHGGPSYAEYTGAKKATTITDYDGNSVTKLWKLKEISVLTGARQNYISQNSTPDTSTVIFRTGLDDGEYYPGPTNRFMDFLKGALGASKQALDWLMDVAGETTDNIMGNQDDDNTASKVDRGLNILLDTLGAANPLAQALSQIPTFDYSREIAVSMATNEVVRTGNNDVSFEDKRNYINGIDNNVFNSIPVNTSEKNYSDGNFYVDDEGKFHSNLGPNGEEGYVVPNETSEWGGNLLDRISFGTTNRIAVRGKNQTQIVVGADGKPVVVIDDYAYINNKSKDKDEIPGFGWINPKQWVSDQLHKVTDELSGRTEGKKNSHGTTIGPDMTTPNTGELSGIPPNIRGVSHLRVTIPFDQWPADKKRAWNKRKGNPIITNTGDYTFESKVLEEGWESPKHTYVDKDQQKRWFKEKDVAPVYPKKAPPKMIRGYHPALLPKLDTPIPQIKVKKKDLLRGHHLKKDEAQKLIDLVDRLNDYIARNPGMLAYARERYPVSDPHLAALNYKLDMQLAAADEYIEKQFPENIRLYNKLVDATKKSIKLSDPKTFKSENGVFTTFNKLARVQHVDNLYQPKERTLKLKKRGKNSVNRFLSKPKEKTKDDILKDKLAVLDKEMQKTMPDKV